MRNLDFMLINFHNCIWLSNKIWFNWDLSWLRYVSVYFISIIELIETNLIFKPRMCPARNWNQQVQTGKYIRQWIAYFSRIQHVQCTDNILFPYYLDTVKFSFHPSKIRPASSFKVLDTSQGSWIGSSKRWRISTRKKASVNSLLPLW